MAYPLPTSSFSRLKCSVNCRQTPAHLAFGVAPYLCSPQRLLPAAVEVLHFLLCFRGLKLLACFPKGLNFFQVLPKTCAKTRQKRRSQRR